MLTTLGPRSFSASAPKIWNELPVELRQATSLNTFKSRFKTYIFIYEVFLCLLLLEKRSHYVIGLSERVKECKSVNATGLPNGIRSKADTNPRLIGT